VFGSVPVGIGTVHNAGVALLITLGWLILIVVPGWLVYLTADLK
jgi:hypothetical protein